MLVFITAEVEFAEQILEIIKECAIREEKDIALVSINDFAVAEYFLKWPKQPIHLVVLCQPILGSGNCLHLIDLARAIKAHTMAIVDYDNDHQADLIANQAHSVLDFDAFVDYFDFCDQLITMYFKNKKARAGFN